MFTGKVVIFKCVWFAEQLLLCLFAIVRVCFHKTKVSPSSFYFFKNSIELILLKIKFRQSFCDGTNISPRFQFLTTSFPFQFGFKYEVHSPIFDVNLVLHAPKHLYLSLHIAYPSTRYREPHKHVVFSVIDWKEAAGIQIETTSQLYTLCSNASNVSVHATLEKFKNATTTGRFRLVFEKNSAREITWFSLRHRF